VGNLVLSLFPGIDLLGLAFEREGWCVVRGPDPITGGDIREFHPPAGVFDGLIGGPPCQIFSILKRLNPLAGEKWGNLIPEFERAVAEAQPRWFVMENVPQAPEPVIPGYRVRSLILNNRWRGEIQDRERRFSFGTADGRQLFVETEALEPFDYCQTVTSSSRLVPVKIGGSGKVKRTYYAPGIQHGPGLGPRVPLREMLHLQGAPADLLIGNAREQG
jgi:DNA (cytosine-5)-methyltransferase 1